MKPPEALSDSELNSYASQHLQYEVDMLASCAVVLGWLSPHILDGFIPWTLVNGLLNSYALHARNLISFLYARSRNTDRDTDIVLEDYVDAERVAAVLPPIPPLLEAALTKTAKQAAHLTKQRIDYESSGKEWHFMQLTAEILRVLSLVAPHIPNERIGADLKQKLSSGHMRVPKIRVNVVHKGGSPTGLTLQLDR